MVGREGVAEDGEAAALAIELVEAGCIEKS